MAPKPRKPGKRKGPRPKGRPKGLRPPLKPIVCLMGTPEYAAWLNRLTEATGQSKADLIADGLKTIAWLRTNVEEPPDRMGG